MARRTYIAELTANQLVSGVFALQNCQLGQTKNGKPFIKCLLGDKSGRTPGRMWSATEELFASLPTDGFVRIEGQTQPYQGEMQIILQSMFPVKPSQADLEELLPCTKFDTEQMFAEVGRILGTIKAAPLKALAAAYLSDEALMKRFKRAPAAQTLHHAFLGGLLEHTLHLLKIAEALSPLYPKLDRDILLMGLFLHDLGKCAELTWETGFAYSDEGQLVGHVARGVVWLNEKAAKLEADGAPLPRPLLNVLEHVILSHHGQYEFGALKLPATPEAILIHYIDNIDAKMRMSLDASRPDAPPAGGTDLGGNFTEKVWALDNVRLYKGDPYREPAASADTHAPTAGNGIPTLRLGGVNTTHKGGM